MQMTKINNIYAGDRQPGSNSPKYNAMLTLYRMGKVSKAGLQEAVVSGVISVDEYQQITGEEYGTSHS